MKVVALTLVATSAASASASQQSSQPCFVPAVGARCNLRPPASARSSSNSVHMKLWDFGLNREVSADNPNGFLFQHVLARARCDTCEGERSK